MGSESDSILISTKKMSGIDREYDVFDLDIITYINTVFMILNQMGVGPETVFSIEDETTTWNEFEEGNIDLKACRAYMAQKVRLQFDPPTSATIKQALQESINELEWRLIHQVEINRHIGET